MSEANGIPLLVFDDSVTERVFQSLGLTINSAGVLVDKDNKVLTNQEFETITAEKFGGVLRGSKIPISKDKTELIKYFVTKTEI